MNSRTMKRFVRKRSVKWRGKNKDEREKLQKQSKLIAKPPVKRQPGKPSKDTRQLVGERDRWRCGYCGLKTKQGAQNQDDEFTVDHLRPQYQGGQHHPDNLITACRFCNMMRGRLDVTPDVFKTMVQNGSVHRISEAVARAEKMVGDMKQVRFKMPGGVTLVGRLFF